MAVRLFVVYAFLKSLAASCNCSSTVNLGQLTEKHDVVFYGTSKSVKIIEDWRVFQVKVISPVKGCLQIDSIAALRSQNIESCYNSNVDQHLHLFMANWDANKVALTLDKCHGIVPLTSISPQTASHIARQYDRGCKQCSNTSPLLKCKRIAACKNFKQACPRAASCDTDPCNTCTPVFLNKAGAQECRSQCPAHSVAASCSADPCKNASKESLVADGCTEASRAVCVVHTCNGCSHKWVDMFGKQVCKQSSLADLCTDRSSINFGVCINRKLQGFGVVKGRCAQVRGCAANMGDVVLFRKHSDCIATCRCRDHQLSSFGGCGKRLGFAVVRGQCQLVKGCKDSDANLGYKLFFPNLQACVTACISATSSAATAAYSAPMANGIVSPTNQPALSITTTSIASAMTNQVGTSLDTNVILETVKSIHNSRKSVQVLLYKFTNDEVYDALKSALKRGVEVQLLCNKDENDKTKSNAQKLKKKGATVKLFSSRQFSEMHAKLMICDKAWAITGSFNWTSAASKNLELFLKVVDANMLSSLIKQFDSMWSAV